MSDQQKPTGPDFEQGFQLSELKDGAKLLGHFQGEPVLAIRNGNEVFAIGAFCTHYHGPLADGLVTGDSVHCPWHHACFNLRTGEATAPALNPVDCWKVEIRGERFFVTGKVTPRGLHAVRGKASDRFVIIGAGAAGNAAAEMLRREGFEGSIVLVGADEAGPVDRPNLSKDYLAGTAPEEWIPLRPSEFYGEKRISLRLGARATAIDPKRRTVQLSIGETLQYEKLLLATGADPIRLPIPGADLPHVRTLRNLGDSRAIIAKALNAKRAVVIGASFIGLEAAASLRARGLEVDVVGRESRPLERVLGTELGDLVREIHEKNGVRFHLERSPKAITEKCVALESGEELAADLVVMGAGVKPSLDLATQLGLALDRGVLVNEHLETSVPGIFAAGDIARWPDPFTGEKIRVEHWVVAERQGQVAAQNMLGAQVRYEAVPFFWSNHFDAQICYVGHAANYDRVEVRGDLRARDATVSYWSGDRVLAVATLGRDLVSLEAERAMEERDQAKLRKLVLA